MAMPTIGSVIRPIRLAVVATLAVVLAACGGSDRASVVAGEAVGFEGLARAASTSAEVTSGRFSFTVTVSSPQLEQELALSGEGAFDSASRRSAFSADLSALAVLLGGFRGGLAGSDGLDLRDLWKVETVRDDATAYVKLPALAGELPEGKTWVRAQDGQVVGAGGFRLRELEQLTQASPEQLLGKLEGLSGEIEVVGTETLRGVETTHYRATVDADSVAAHASGQSGQGLGALVDRLGGQSGLSEVTLDIWIDGDGLVRKVLLDVEATQPGDSTPSRATLGFELWDVGEPVAIELPPASRVVDVSELER